MVLREVAYHHFVPPFHCAAVDREFAVCIVNVPCRVTHQRLQERGFARTRLTDDGHASARRYLEADAGQNRRAAVAGRDPPDRQGQRARRGGRASHHRQAFGLGSLDVPGAQAAHGPAGYGHRFRDRSGAVADGVVAARGERAAGAAVARPGLLAVDAGQYLGALGRRHGSDQAAGVRMHRLGE